ncbi:hypothetical protein [Streptomyces sp. SM11]|uniref:hypothetical protein n=1 Tax=Streptomyces sp. SM11 TaxID=565557 RepID=UPI000CD51BE3|nr:hypothetical protein [Streptomyces sp. SM11]
MLQSLSESGQAAADGGGTALVVALVVLFIWLYHRDKNSTSVQAIRARHKHEITTWLRSRPAEDRPIVIEVLAELDAEDEAKKKDSKHP